jgi:HSP20 family protein
VVEKNMSDLATPTPSDSAEIVPYLGFDWSDLEQAFARFRHDLLPGFDFVPAFPKFATDAVATDIADLGTSYEVRADLPGFSKEKIEVRVRGRVLELKAEQVAASEERNGKQYLRQERSIRSVERAFELPEPVVADQVKARYENGVLTVSIPKAHPAADQKVAVE